MNLRSENVNNGGKFRVFDRDRTLEGSGSGGSASGRLNALINQIEAAGDLSDAGLIDEACGQLASTLKRTDGVFPPPDFVSGEAAAELALLIEIMRASLSCP